MERNGVVRRFRPADGARLGAARSHVAGDPRVPLDRFPPARAARDARAAGPDVRLHLASPRGGRGRTSAGGGRDMNLTLVEGATRNRARSEVGISYTTFAVREGPLVGGRTRG